MPGASARALSVDVVHVLAGQLANARRGGIAVLLPGRYTVDVPRVYGSGGAVRGGYDLLLAGAPGCGEATACFLASFSGQRSGTLSGGARVALAHGLTGRYRATSCGASCSPGAVAWREGGVRYEIQANVVGPERAALVALADSAISAGAR